MASPVWRNRDFLIALGSRAGSRFGDEVALVALTLRIQAGGGRPWQVAVLLAAGLIPLIVLSGPVGRVVDSVDSRRILLVATLVEVGACAPLIVTHSFPVMVALVALIAVGSAFTSTTWQALIPTIVGEDQVGRATSASQTGFALATIGAPAVAGLLSGAFGTAPPLALDTASFAVMAVAVLAIRSRRRAHPAGGAHAGSGWAALRRDRLVGTLAVGLAVMVLLALMTDVVEVFLVRVTLHASAAWYGGALAAWLFGMVGGSVLAGRFGVDASRARATVAGAGLISLALVGFSAVPSVIWLLPVGLLGGLGNGAVNVCVGTLITTRTPDHLRGRVFAALGALINGASVLSLAAGGVVGGLLGPRHVFLLGGLLCLATTVLLAVRMATLWSDAPPSGEPTEQADAVALAAAD